MNPILDRLQSNQPSPITQLWNTYRTAQNPRAVVDAVMKQNPMLGQIIGDADPKDVFYGLCQQRGIDPESILKQFR